MSDQSQYKKIDDSDADGLSDAEENAKGTNPLDSDTDKDDLGDYQELKVYGTDPLDPDTDKDGISDGQEIKLGRNPRGSGLLKDLFIPHEGNDYKPQALQPRRLFFHALAAMAIKVLFVAFLLSFPIQAWLTPDILLEQSRRIVDLTNNIRTGLNLAGLTNNTILEKAALAKAQDMFVGQYFAHVSPEKKSLRTFLDIYGYGFRMAGENLALGFASADEVVTAWKKSPTHYANLIDSDFTEIGVAAVSGQYQGYDTTLVAQFFGRPKIMTPEISKAPTEEIVTEPVLDIPTEIIPEEEIIEETNNMEVLAEDINSEPLLASQLDQSKTSVFSSQTPDRENLIFKVTAHLGDNTKQVVVNVGGQSIELYPDLSETNRWTGHLVVAADRKKEFLDPVVLASLTARDEAGHILTEDINWTGVIASQASALDQYSFLKANKPNIIKPLFDISYNYYFLILGLAVLAVLLNIFVHIRHQHAHVILSSLAFVFFIGLLILW